MQIPIYYCYNNKCPKRTEKEPWPRSDGELKYITFISKKGKPYKLKKVVCIHCNEIMQGAVGLNY